MRIAAVSQRLCLIRAGGAIDVHAASNGQFDADPAAVYPRWPEFTEWAASASLPDPPPFAPKATVAPAPRQVYGIGLNYSDHVAESGFAKPDTTSQLTFGVPELIEQLSAVTPLLPGDLIFTGTPSGVGLGRTPQRWLQPGDVLTSYIEGVGEMRHTFVTA